MENGQVVEAGSVLDVFGKPQAPVTRRFVQTVVNDQIPESILSLVKEQKEHFKAMQNSGEQRPPMGGPGMRGGRPPMGGGEPPMMGEGGFPGGMGERPMMNKEQDSADAQKKAAETKEKKIKKILTTEQYEKWQAQQASARQKHSPK